MNTIIKRIYAKNFRSYENLDISFGNLNLLIGTNASGKSNLIQVLKFIHDIYEYGIEQAIGFQGGLEFIKFLNAEKKKPIKIEIEVEINEIRGFRNNKYPDTFILPKSLSYSFSILPKTKFRYSIIEDRLKINCRVDKRGNKKDKSNKKNQLTNLEVIIEKKKSDVDVSLNPTGNTINIDKEQLFPSQLRDLKIKNHFEKSLLLEEPYGFFPFRWGEFAELIKLYDFDPKLPKKSIPLTSGFVLQENGENMANTLKKVLSTKENKRKFFNLLSELIPTIKDIKVSSLSDKSVYFTIKEDYFTRREIPASMISDGTIHSIGLILALYFEDNEIVVIEEPERNIHPKLISRIAELLKEASKKKQIFITTHNPIFLKNYSLENIFVCKRINNGRTSIVEASKDENLSEFLENDLGLDDLLIQNLF